MVSRRHPARVEDHPWRFGRDFLHEGAQLRGRNTGVRLLPFGRRVLDRLAQVVHPRDEAGDEVLVVRFLLQQLMDDGQVERVVAVRAHLPVAVGFAGGEAGARIDVRDPHPAGHRGHERLRLLDHQRFDDVATVEHEVPGVLQVEYQPRVAEAEQRTRRVVNVAAAGDVVIEVVRRAERPHESLRQVDERAATVRERDAARTASCDRLAQPVGNVVERLVP